MREFRNITAICVDTKNHAMAAKAASICEEKCKFGRILLLSDIETTFPIKKIGRLNGIADYNRIILEGIADLVETEFALIFQWDGFVLNPARWSEEFAAYDYIGAPWSEASVGNGGFSLRSRRLLERSRTMPKDFSKNEDGVVCGEILPALIDEGFICAPVDVASRFSFETTLPPVGGTFGFHGDYNFAAVLSEAELTEFITLSDGTEDLWTNRRPLKWVDAVAARGDVEVAARLLDHCRAIRPAETAHWLLGKLREQQAAEA